MSRRIVALLVVIGATLLGGCTSSPSNTSGTQSASASRTGSQLPTLPPGSSRPSIIESGGASTSPAGPVVALGDADKGKTIPVAVGEQVTLTLAGTDWRHTDPKPASVLTPMSAPVVADGKASISFRAAKPGTAIVTATRGAESYQITIVVQ